MMGMVTGAITNLLNISFIFSFHNSDPEPTMQMNFQELWFYKLILLVIHISQCQYNVYYVVCGQRLFLVYNFIPKI